MNFYKLGLAAGDVVIPDEVYEHPAYHGFTRVSDGVSGFRSVVRNGSSFYQRGITGKKPVVLGATTPLGKATEGLVGLILDIAHVLLILAGMYTLWGALRP